jgi:hypothetical protein
MESHLVAFLAGFAVCALGIGVALVFDITLSRLATWCRRR